MRHKLIIDGNAVYEMDDECLRCQAQKAKEPAEKNTKEAVTAVKPRKEGTDPKQRLYPEQKNNNTKIMNKNS